MNLCLMNRITCRKFQNVCKVGFYNFSRNVSGEYVTIYKFPYIRVASLVNRLKIYQTAATVVSIPGSVVLYQNGLLNIDAVLTCWIFGKRFF